MMDRYEADQGSSLSSIGSMMPRYRCSGRARGSDLGLAAARRAGDA